MRLKRLDIFAFKSFMDRTSLSFPAGLSAIVGPNGCGKSNLLDAIRWAIGEQSARSLRGRLMEDVIFAGTHGRRPLGLAEVSLTLESTNGHPAFAGAPELTITRRLHRSGESEFLLNRRPCRLKDIAHIFLGTGLGGRGYGIIEQGKVDQIIDQRPEERRGLVEEAAGISRYRLERAETVRKLEAAQANLTRLQDVLAEISRQLSSLARQRSLAERHARLRERLRAVELAQAARQFLTAQAELAQAEEALRGLAAQEAQTLEARRTLAAEKTRSEEELGRALAGREGLREQAEALRAELAAVEAASQALEAEVAMLGREAGRLSQGAQEAGRRATEAASQLEGCQARCAETRGQREAVEAELARLPSGLAEGAEELARLRESAERAKGELIAALAARAEAANALRSLQARQAELAARLARKEREARAARDEAQGLEERQAALAAKLSGLAGQANEAKAREESLEGAARQAKERAQELSALLRRQRSELEGLNSRLASLKELSAAARGEAAQGLLEAAGELGAEHFPLAEALEVPQELEGAVSAALGERLRSVVFTRTADALRALARHRERGRGVALALALDRTPLAVNGSRRLGQGDLSALLGGLQTAATLDEAAAGAAGGCILTTDGAAFLPGGWLAASGREAAGALLSWQREIKALGAHLGALKAQAAQTENDLAAQQAELAGLMRGLEAARAEARERAAALERLEDDSHEVTRRLAATGERLRLAEIEARHARQAAAEAEGQLAGAQEALQAAQAGAAECERLLAGVQAAATEAERAQAGLLERQAALKARLAALSEREQAARAEAERLSAARAQAEAEAAALLRQAEAARGRAAELAARKEEAAAQAAGLAERLAALEAERAAVQEQTQGLRGALAEVSGRLGGLEAELEALRGRLSAASLARSEAALRLEGIAARAAELHDCDLAPQAAELAAALPPETDCAAEARRLRESLLRLGEVNPAAPREHEELSARHAELIRQSQDVAASIANLKQALASIDRTCRQQFLDTFEKLNGKLAHVFTLLFGGGTARLELVGEDPLAAGVDIICQPPGKKLTHMSLLSGGEKAMAATALLFALHLLRPSPFYLLDELDAALDDTNAARLGELMRELSAQSQLIVVTHNKRTLELADTLYGVTMEEPGVSKLVSVRLSQLANTP